MSDKQNLLNEHIQVLFDDSSLRNVFERSDEDAAAKKRRELRDILKMRGLLYKETASIDIPVGGHFSPVNNRK